MIVSFGSDNVRDFLLAIMAVSTFGTAVITGWTKRAQRKRDEKKARLDAEVARELTERDRKKIEFDKAVAEKVEQVANAAQGVKNDLALSSSKTTKAICEVKDKVDEVHTIVNSERTRMMEELLSSRSLNLSLAKALFRSDPNSKDAKTAVDISQSLYDRLSTDIDSKKESDRKK